MTNLISGLKYGALLGTGHFGKVYLGQDQAHGQVAVKVLSRDASWTDHEWAHRKGGYMKEARHLSRAAHAHVVNVHHVNEAEDGNSVVICMEYCPGGSLQESYEFGPLPIGKVRDLATDVLLGLQCLHLRDMLHRDIKPANILINAQGAALIGDFGLVTDDLIMGYGSAAGYTDHIAYEVWKGNGTSVKTDIWAVGATLYRLLHGKHWYDELPLPRDLIVHGGFADGLPWLPHVPKRWRRIIRQMLEDDPAKRYQSAEATLAAVGKVPITPTWETTVEPDLVRWKHAKGSRVQIVEWIRTPRKNEWTAWSEPKAGVSGRKMTLGGSNGVVPLKTAISGLEKFLS